jgi:hypothetical protein
MLYSKMMLFSLVAAKQGLRVKSEPINTDIFVDPDDHSGYDNCETPGDCAAPCASPQTFHVRMCESHMCTLCAEPWCHESCRKLQEDYPTCRCPTWRDGKKTYSVSDIPEVDMDCLLGGVWSSSYEGGNEGAIPDNSRRYGDYGSTGVRSTEQKHCGESSAKFEGGSWQLIENAARGTLEAGLSYVISFWAYGAGGQQIRTEVLQYNDDSASISGTFPVSDGNFVATHTIGQADTWVKYTHTLTAGATKDFRLNVGIPNGGPCYVDDVNIARAGP